MLPHCVKEDWRWMELNSYLFWQYHIVLAASESLSICKRRPKNERCLLVPAYYRNRRLLTATRLVVKVTITGAQNNLSRGKCGILTSVLSELLCFAAALCGFLLLSLVDVWPGEKLLQKKEIQIDKVMTVCVVSPMISVLRIKCTGG